MECAISCPECSDDFGLEVIGRTPLPAQLSLHLGDRNRVALSDLWAAGIQEHANLAGGVHSCNRCGSSVDHIVAKAQKLPTFLVLSLVNNFVYTGPMAAGVGKFRPCDVYIPLVLDAAAALTVCGHAAFLVRLLSVGVQVNIQVDGGCTQYRLCNVIVRSSTGVNSGHYVAYKFHSVTQHWYMCNDDFVTPVHESVVLGLGKRFPNLMVWHDPGNSYIL